MPQRLLIKFGDKHLRAVPMNVIDPSFKACIDQCKVSTGGNCIVESRVTDIDFHCLYLTLANNTRPLFRRKPDDYSTLPYKRTKYLQDYPARRPNCGRVSYNNCYTG